jgi:hypothetical protein
MPDIKTLLALIAGALALISFIPYLVTTVRGTTKPNRATWSIWTLQGWLLTSSYYASGGEHTIVDSISLLGAGISIGLWILLGSPLTALYFGIVVSLIGAVPTLYKTYREPETENSLSWGIFSCAAIINLFALPTLLAAENIYPFYLLCINGAVFLLAFFGNQRSA